ncbi:hypothetical protein FRC02_009757 [Tulasnella sp. 418]|nr:hypothetical protein FRC02_009757 [Tulasnella sp. 418]
MSVDPAVLSSTFPGGRKLHYWAKASLFGHPIAKKVLLDAGNIPVNRKSSDKQAMFKGTFDALAVGEVVALFPEGTSYTEPRIMQVKDGAAWAALEYMKWSQSEEGKAKGAKELVVLPAGLVYTNKSKYRSSALIEFGKPITLSKFTQEFLAPTPDAPRLSVKKLTKAIEKNLVELTINAPDWETLYCARMARELLWENERTLNLDDFVSTSQLLVDLFAHPNGYSSFPALKAALLKYSSLLKVSHLTNESLSALPLPRTLDPSHPVPLPSRLSTLSVLLFSTFACIIRLPFFVVPIIMHAPAYVMARYGARLAAEEEESQAQNKIVFGLLLTTFSYGILFWLMWAIFWLTPVGAATAAATVWLIYQYHVRLIDDVYTHAKRLVAAWRVLLGVWGPKQWEMGLAALTQYTIPVIPPPNPWIDKPLPRSGTATPIPPPETKPATTDGDGSSSKTTSTIKKKAKRPSSRRLIRHVLRARIEASQALATFLEELEYKSPRIRVSSHLGHPEGQVEEGYVSGMSSTSASERSGYVDASGNHNSNSSDSLSTPVLLGEGEKKAYLEGKEIIALLRRRGARVKHEGQHSDWAAVVSSSEGEDNSGAEGEGEDDDADADEVVWVSPSAST